MQVNKEDKMLTTSEIHLETEVCPRTLNKWLENGYIQPKGQNDKGKNLISLLDVIKYETSHPIKNRDLVWDEIIPQKGEDFRLIEGYDDRYAASRNRIVNFTSGRVLGTDHPREDGYVVVYLQKDGDSKPIYAHCLTAEMFCPNKRKKLFPNLKWEMHHIEIGFEHRKDINPDKLLPVMNEEHDELHRLWNNGKITEYWKMIESIKKQNNEEWFKIPHPDYKSDEYSNYFIILNEKGYLAYKSGKEIPLDSIRCESMETVKSEANAE